MVVGHYHIHPLEGDGAGGDGVIDFGGVHQEYHLLAAGPKAGDSLHLIGGQAADEKALGVIEFIKFFMLQEKQVEFSLRSGYRPIRADVMENPQYKDYIANVNPGSWKIVEKVMNSTWPRGALFGSLGEFRKNVASQVVAMAEDPSITVETAVKQIARDTNEQIELYNLSN